MTYAEEVKAAQEREARETELVVAREQKAMQALIKTPGWKVYEAAVQDAIALAITVGGGQGEHQTHQCMMSYLKGLQDSLQIPIIGASALSIEELKKLTSLNEGQPILDNEENQE